MLGWARMVLPVPLLLLPPLVAGQCDTSALVQLDFNAATLASSSNNFKANNAQIRFGGIGTYLGEDIDLVIGETTPSASSACSGNNNACKATKPGSFGTLSWKQGVDEFLNDL